MQKMHHSILITFCLMQSFIQSIFFTFLKRPAQRPVLCWRIVNSGFCFLLEWKGNREAVIVFEHCNRDVLARCYLMICFCNACASEYQVAVFAAFCWHGQKLNPAWCFYWLKLIHLHLHLQKFWLVVVNGLGVFFKPCWTSCHLWERFCRFDRPQLANAMGSRI